MRDVIVVFIFVVWLLFAFLRPHVGVLLLSWLGYMNPHRLSWGFAYNLPLSYTAALVTIPVFLFSKEKKSIPINAITIFWLLFLGWICITTLAAFHPEQAQQQLIKVLKIQIVIYLTLAMFTSKERIHQLLWVIVVSIGFYGVKGGVFTLMTGGSGRVWGPEDSFIHDNNELAVALLMIVPLMVYLRGYLKKTWQQHLMLACIALVILSVLGTQSRGAFVAILSLGVFFWLKSNNKLASFLAFLILGGFTLYFMPESWFDRMQTITEYKSDASAMGRIHAWTLAWNIANERLLGGGFNLWSSSTYLQFLPSYDPSQQAYVAHSIYFSVLGEHGWIGLILFLGVFFASWRTASRMIKQYKEVPEKRWIADLARMCQLSLIAYMSGGAFLSLSYFDLPWHIAAILALMNNMNNSVSKKI